jgi:hypothetical protein
MDFHPHIIYTFLFRVRSFMFSARRADAVVGRMRTGA